VANSLNNLAALYDIQGQYAKAEPLMCRALAIDEKTYGLSIVTWPQASTLWRRSTKRSGLCYKRKTSLCAFTRK